MANFEYTPEITAQFRESLRRPEMEREAQNIGKVRGEALRRGMEGDPFESLGVAAERKATGERLSDIDANMAYNVAGMQREERMGAEQFGRQKELTQMQNAQREREMSLQNNYNKEMMKFQNRLQRKSMWEQLPGQILGTGLGMYTGAKLGKMF